MKVQLWNRTAEQLFHWSGNEVLGRPDPTVPTDKYDEFLSLYELAQKGRKVHLKTVRQRKDSGGVKVNITMIPLKNGEESGSLMTICEPLRPLQTGVAPRTQDDASDQARRVEVKAGIEALTPREREIVELLVARGDTTRVLAQRLQLREQVVRNYLHRIYRQLHVASRSELIALLSN
jgi:DNA-binding CsgD family transcriptional regulator